MALSFIKPTNPPNPPDFKLLVGRNYESALYQSLQTLLDFLENKDANLSDFVNTFYEFMQVRVDPPLETIWVYSALSFHALNSPKDDFLDQISSVRDLFQLVSTCSAPCSGSKSVALLAPVVFEVCKLVDELWSKGLSSKREKKMMRQVRSLVDVVLGYISVCCSKSYIEAGASPSKLIRPLKDLVRLWKMGKNVASNGVLRSFFPLVTEEITVGISEVSGDVDELAGVVMAEVFLLRMCLYFSSGATRLEMEKDLKNWAAASFTGFRNPYFFETLLRVLLEPTLPVTALLNSEDESILRKVLYDAVILVGFSLLDLEHATKLPVERTWNLTLIRLIIIHEAVELFRKEGNQGKAASFTNAFSSSSLPARIIKMVTSRMCMGMQDCILPTGSSPTSFIKWLLNLEDHGIRMFPEGIFRLRHKLLLDVSTAEGKQTVGNADTQDMDADLQFYIDKEGEKIDDEGKQPDENLNAAFMAAAQSMSITETGDGKKRKVEQGADKVRRTKFVKYNISAGIYNISDDSGASEDLSHVDKDNSDSGSDLDDRMSDEEMEVNEQ